MTIWKMAGMRAAGLASALCLCAMAFGTPASASVAPDDDWLQQAAPTVDETPVIGQSVPEGVFKLAFSTSYTNNIVNRLGEAEAECGGLQEEYRADCLQQGFRHAVSATGNKTDYQTVTTELNRATREISALVKQNADPAAPPIRKGGKTYRAIKKSAVKSVNARARAIIAEAETKLLRSATGHRQVHYQRIAQALGSTKKILRS